MGSFRRVLSGSHKNKKNNVRTLPFASFWGGLVSHYCCMYYSPCASPHSAGFGLYGARYSSLVTCIFCYDKCVACSRARQTNNVDTKETGMVPLYKSLPPHFLYIPPKSTRMYTQDADVFQLTVRLQSVQAPSWACPFLRVPYCCELQLCSNVCALWLIGLPACERWFVRVQVRRNKNQGMLRVVSLGFPQFAM